MKISNKQVYRVFKTYGLLQKKQVREAPLSPAPAEARDSLEIFRRRATRPMSYF